jgi:hypothetical protein
MEEELYLKIVQRGFDHIDGERLLLLESCWSLHGCDRPLGIGARLARFHP